MSNSDEGSPFEGHYSAFILEEIPFCRGWRTQEWSACGARGPCRACLGRANRSGRYLSRTCRIGKNINTGQVNHQIVGRPSREIRSGLFLLSRMCEQIRSMSFTNLRLGSRFQTDLSFGLKVQGLWFRACGLGLRVKALGLELKDKASKN